MRASQLRHAIAAASILILAACGAPSPRGGVAGQTATPAPTATTTPIPSPAVSPTPTVAPTPTPTPTSNAPFVCQASAEGGSPAARSGIADVRVGQHEGYDRFVVEFTGPVPAYRVSLRPGTTFTLSPSGRDVTLAGTSGVLAWISPVADWTSYTGAQAFEPGYPVLREARLIENFESIQQWALGVEGPTCLRVFTMDAPARLVIDVAPAG